MIKVKGERFSVRKVKRRDLWSESEKGGKGREEVEK
jgi:hypothetical protein